MQMEQKFSVLQHPCQRNWATWQHWEPSWWWLFIVAVHLSWALAIHLPVPVPWPLPNSCDKEYADCMEIRYHVIIDITFSCPVCQFFPFAFWHVLGFYFSSFPAFPLSPLFSFPATPKYPMLIHEPNTCMQMNNWYIK